MYVGRLCADHNDARVGYHLCIATQLNPPMPLVSVVALLLSLTVHCACWIWAVSNARIEHRLVVACVPVLWAFHPEWLAEDSTTMRKISVGTFGVVIASVAALVLHFT